MDDSGEISKLLHKSLLPKLDEIVAALGGIVTPLQRALLAQILDHIDDLDKRIQELDRMAEAYMAEFQSTIAEVCQMPGIARRSSGGDRHRHEPVPLRGASVLLGGSLPRQQPECREAVSRQDTQGE